MSRAKEASARELGKKAEEIDDIVAQGKFDKCYPMIVSVWNARRGRLEAEYLTLLDEVANAPLILTYSPSPLKMDPKTSKAVAQVSVVEQKEVPAKVARMKKVATELTGEFPTLHSFYSWSAGGKASNNQEQKTYEYDAPGFYVVEVTRHVVSKAHGPKVSAEVTQGIDVVVEGRKADGTYEGTLEFDSIRLVDENGVATELDVKKIESGQVKLKLVIQGETSTMALSAPSSDEGAVTVKLSGQFSEEKYEASLTQIDSYDLQRPGIRKLEMSASGRLTEADSVAGTWKFYIAVEVPSAEEGETEMGFVHASGKWKAKLKAEPVKPKPSSAGNAAKSGKKK